MERFDYFIIGGGLFGAYAALYLEGKGHRVCLLEKERALFQKASLVNQARLHGGYHYPRSIATARMSDDHRERFTREHAPFVLTQYEKYYAIDKYSSFTDAAQFERFCDYVGIPCKRVEEHPLFDFHRLEALYLTTEYTFDPPLIAQWYRERLRNRPHIVVRTQARVLHGETGAGKWLVEWEDLPTGRRHTLEAGGVLNATYTASNAVNRLFGLGQLELMHEISEIALLTSPQLPVVGLTVMDGQFASLMPFGKSGLLSLSSVAYTHHKVSYEPLPTFDCQQAVRHCRPDFPANCNACPARPRSAFAKMAAQIKLYLQPETQLHYFGSLFTIKSKLKANFIDDGRPTEINVLHADPPFYCIFAGKINSIYEIEKVL